MPSTTLLLAISQIVALVAGTGHSQSPYDAAIPAVKRAEHLNEASTTCSVITVCSTQTSSTLTTTTTPATTVRPSSTKTSTTPCPTSSFILRVSPSNSAPSPTSYVFVDLKTNRFTLTTNASAANQFFLGGTPGRLISVTSRAGAATVTNDTGTAGNYIAIGFGQGYDFLNATFGQNCNIFLNTKVSDTLTLDTIYAVPGQPQSLYIQPKSRPAPSGGQLVPYFIQVPLT